MGPAQTPAASPCSRLAQPGPESLPCASTALQAGRPRLVVIDQSPCSGPLGSLPGSVQKPGMELRLHATAALCGEGAEWGPWEGQACIMGLRESTVEGGVGGWCPLVQASGSA